MQEESVFDSFQFPSDWQMNKLRRVFNNTKTLTSGQLPLLGANVALGVTERYEGDGRPAASEDLSKYKVVEVDDIIMNPLGKPHGSIGRSNLVGITSPAYWVLRCNAGFEPRYAHYLLRSEVMINEYKRRSKNLPPNQFDLPWEQFREIEIGFPSLQEQRRIADYLDATCEYIDMAVTATSKLLISSEEILISKLDELFVEKPTPDFLLGKMGVSISLFRAGIRGQAGQTPKSSEARFWTESGFGTPWLSISDLVSRGRIISSEKDVTDLGLMEIGMKPSEEETLLFAMYASMGKVSFAPPGFVWSQAILGLATGDVDKYFLAAWFEVARPHLKALARSSTQDNLNADQVMSLRIPVIARGEQTLIGKMYLSMVDEHLKRNMILEEQTRLLNELKVSLIAGAITGTFDLTSGRSVA